MGETTVRDDDRRYLGGYPAASRYSGLSEMTLRRLVEAGRLHVYRPTGERIVLFDPLELDALILGSAACQTA